jgi:hypothetical protein
MKRHHQWHHWFRNPWRLIAEVLSEAFHTLNLRQEPSRDDHERSWRDDISTIIHTYRHISIETHVYLKSYIIYQISYIIHYILYLIYYILYIIYIILNYIKINDIILYYIMLNYITLNIKLYIYYVIYIYNIYICICIYICISRLYVYLQPPKPTFFGLPEKKTCLFQNNPFLFFSKAFGCGKLRVHYRKLRVEILKTLFF